MKNICVLVLALLVLVSRSHAGLIFESGAGDFDSTTQSGAFVNSSQFIGVTFGVSETTRIDGIGAHFRNFSNAFGRLFGAIVAVDSAGLPLGSKTHFEQVFGFAVFNPLSSVDTLAPLDVVLEAGQYALVFGSGLFGANGRSALTLLAPEHVANPAGLMVATPTPLPFWIGLDAYAGRFRMFASGSVVDVPEPGGLGHLFALLMLVILANRAGKEGQSQI